MTEAKFYVHADIVCEHCQEKGCEKCRYRGFHRKPVKFTVDKSSGKILRIGVALG